MKRILSIFSIVALATVLLTRNSSSEIKACFTCSDSCGQKFTYEKSSDHDDSRVHFEFEEDESWKSDYKRKISLTAESGYRINKVWLSVDNDGYDGYHLYSEGPLVNFNPDPGRVINWAKAEVEKVCPTLTPTNSPTPTPSPEPTCTEPVCEWVAESECSETCGGGVQDWYHRGEGCDNAYEQRVCNEHACEQDPSVTPSPSPVPTETEKPKESNNNATSEASAPVCNDTVPSAPSILSVINNGSNSVKVTWTKVTPANSYSIMYGSKSGDYPYSVFSTRDTDNYVINGMASGCFTVKAVNGCMPGALSAEKCTGQVAGAVLGASTLGATGGFVDLVNNVMLALGSLLTALGVKKSFFKKV